MFVNNLTGADTNSGQTAACAVATIARAVALARPGDTLVLTPTGRPYAESLRLHGRSGTPTAPLVVEGNGAVLTGLRPLPADQWQVRPDGLCFYPHPRRGARRPYLVEKGRPVAVADRPESLPPGAHCWTTNGLFFRPAAGATLADHALEGTLLDAGAHFSDVSYVTVRNLTCEYFSNDGFNVHGECRGLVFENIIGRHNGDDGFSVHEDVEAVVRGGWFHDNDYGIQDVNAARSFFHGVRVERNRKAGVHFSGGLHTLTDSVVRDHRTDAILITPNSAAHIGLSDDHPLARGLVALKNVRVQGAAVGVHAGAGATVAVTHCHVAGCARGVVADIHATIHMHWSVIESNTVAEVNIGPGARAALDHNRYKPGRMIWQGVPYGPEAWAAYRAASEQDAHSRSGPAPGSADPRVPPETAAPGKRVPGPTAL